MKTYRMLSVVVLMMTGWITSFGQAIEPQVPGDQFSLEGALELFKKSASPEEFEKMLNSPDAKVNNLDLNGDGYIDYIRVQDRYEGNVHAFILQAVVSENEIQDVAVIELEKLSNGKAVLQIIGDEDVYGVTTIIEPTREVRTYAGTQTTRTVVNVWAWPSVQYIYGPRYSAWVSPWGWYSRPVWWHSWRPVAYVHYYTVWRPYHTHYVYCDTRRIARAHYIYRPHRTTSVIVRHRHQDQLVRYRTAHRDEYRNGRTREEVRRTYARDDRSSTYQDANRRRSPQREVQPNRERPAAQRNAPAQRNVVQPDRREAPARRSAPAPRALENRQDAMANPPAASRTRPVQRPSTQPSAARQRADVQRAPAVSQQSAPTRRAEPERRNQAVRERVMKPSGDQRSSGREATPTRSSDRSRGRQ